MKCYYHKKVEAVHSCKLCAHPLCQKCARELKGHYYCDDCLQKLINGQLVAEKLPSKSPGGAALLSLIPGLGQIYNGQIIKGIAIIFLFVSFILLAESYEAGPLFPLLIMAVYFGGIIDAYRTAKLLNLRAKKLELGEKVEAIPQGSMWWGVLLVIAGLLLLLHNMGISLYWVSRGWPLIIIALGIYMLRNFFLGLKKEEEKGEEAKPKKGEKK